MPPTRMTPPGNSTTCSRPRPRRLAAGAVAGVAAAMLLAVCLPRRRLLPAAAVELWPPLMPRRRWRPAAALPQDCSLPWSLLSPFSSELLPVKLPRLSESTMLLLCGLLCLNCLLISHQCPTVSRRSCIQLLLLVLRSLVWMCCRAWESNLRSDVIRPLIYVLGPSPNMPIPTRSEAHAQTVAGNAICIFHCIFSSLRLITTVSFMLHPYPSSGSTALRRAQHVSCVARLYLQSGSLQQRESHKSPATDCQTS